MSVCLLWSTVNWYCPVDRILHEHAMCMSMNCASVQHWPKFMPRCCFRTALWYNCSCVKSTELLRIPYLSICRLMWFCSKFMRDLWWIHGSYVDLLHSLYRGLLLHAILFRSICHIQWVQHHMSLCIQRIESLHIRLPMHLWFKAACILYTCVQRIPSQWALGNLSFSNTNLVIQQGVSRQLE